VAVQLDADASQKATCPTVTVVLPDCTVPVNVTTVPEVTEETADPIEVTVRFVVVADG
jgi:hypothetical protein